MIVKLPNLSIFFDGKYIDKKFKKKFVIFKKYNNKIFLFETIYIKYSRMTDPFDFEVYEFEDEIYSKKEYMNLIL